MKLGIIMDPINEIDIKKDSSFAMLLAAQKRGWSIHYMESDDLYMDNEIPKARMQFLEVKENPKKWFKLDKEYIDEISNNRTIYLTTLLEKIYMIYNEFW